MWCSCVDEEKDVDVEGCHQDDDVLDFVVRECVDIQFSYTEVASCAGPRYATGDWGCGERDLTED